VKSASTCVVSCKNGALQGRCCATASLPAAPQPRRRPAAAAQPVKNALFSVPRYPASPRPCASASWEALARSGPPQPAHAQPCRAHLHTGSTCTSLKSNLAERASVLLAALKRAGAWLCASRQGAAPAANRPVAALRSVQPRRRAPVVCWSERVCWQGRRRAVGARRGRRCGRGAGGRAVAAHLEGRWRQRAVV